MASPFAVFRKNQQTLLVLLFILAMFAFIILSNLNSRSLDLPLLGMLIGMIVLTVAGVIMKKPMQYAAAGAIGGWLAGYLAVWSGFDTSDDSIVVTSSLGSLNELDVKQMIDKRHLANDFLQRAVMKSMKDQEDPRMLQSMLQRVMEQYGFGFGGSAEQQLALSTVLRSEADKMGIAIDADAVTAYIHEATQNKLTIEDFKGILSEMKVSENTLYDLIADELKVKTALQLLAPNSVSSTPERLWENFKKMEVTQSLQTVAVPVDAFNSEVPEPTDDQLQAFFEAHKNVFPGALEPGSVGFRQPRKIQLAYLEASYLDAEDLVAGEITDDKIEQFYEDNKDILFLNRQVPDFSRGELIEPSNKSDLPDLDRFDPSKPENATDKGEVPLRAPGQSGDSENKVEDKETSPAEKPAEEPKQESSLSTSNRSLQPVSFLNQPDKDNQTEKPAEPPKPEEKPDPKAETKQPEKPGAKSTVPPAPEEPAKTVPPAPTEPGKELPPSPEEPVGEQPLVAEKPQPKYQPLDSGLRDSIRDQLLRDKARAKQKELTDLALEKMVELSNQYFNIGTREFNKELTPEQANAARLKLTEDAEAELKKLAEENKGLFYAVIPTPLDYQEMTESAEHRIGSAVVGDDPKSESALSVADKMFRGSPESIYEAERAITRDFNSSFAFWKTADEASHVPTFEEDGVREQVLETWIEQESRPLAENRAKELKDKLEKTDSTWSELLAEETITGEKEGQVLSTRTTKRFSWIETSSVPSQFGFNMDRAVLATIPGIEKIDNEFMKKIFLGLKSGEVGVVPNFDKSVYYVVKVLDRKPADQAGWEAKMDQFLKADMFGFFSTYAQVSGEERNELSSEWMKSLLASYDVKIRGEAPR